MTADQVLGICRHDGVTLRAVKGRILLTPKDAVTERHRAMVAAKKAEVLALLERYPGGEAKAFATFKDEQGRLSGYVPRPDELGRPTQGRPRVITGRRWRR